VQTSAVVQHLIINEFEASQRLDNFLLKNLKGAPRSLIYRIIRSGEVRINKVRIKPGYRLQIGDSLRIPPIRLAKRDEIIITPNKLELLQNAVIFNDHGLLVINKPSGMAVHGGSGIDYGVIEGMRKLYSHLPELELVHRLDRDTSGLLMLASKRSMLRYLHEQLREGLINKQYLALVKGLWHAKNKDIKVSLLKNTLRSGERIIKADANGKYAHTKFKLVKNFNNVASLVEASPITGRTHQIRVHAQYADAPIAGDIKYGDDGFSQFIYELTNNKRLFLHAHKLTLKLPDNSKLVLTAPIDEIWHKVIAKLELV